MGGKTKDPADDKTAERGPIIVARSNVNGDLRKNLTQFSLAQPKKGVA